MAKLWHVGIKGPFTTEVQGALERAGLPLTGLSHAVSTGGGGVAVESHSIFVEAPTADEAIKRAQSAVDGLAVHVGETAREVDTGDASGSTGAP